MSECNIVRRGSDKLMFESSAFDVLTQFRETEGIEDSWVLIVLVVHMSHSRSRNNHRVRGYHDSVRESDGFIRNAMNGNCSEIFSSLKYAGF